MCKIGLKMQQGSSLENHNSNTSNYGEDISVIYLKKEKKRQPYVNYVSTFAPYFPTVFRILYAATHLTVCIDLVT